MVLMTLSGFQPVHQMILARALVQPDEACVIDDKSQLNYREFAQRVGQWGAWLAKNNLRKGNRVGLLMSNTADHLAMIMALSAAGVVHLSLTLADSLEINQRLIESLGIGVIISDGIEEFPGCSVLHTRTSTSVKDDTEFSLKDNIGPDDPWKIVLSSGSTGQPKMILQTQLMELGYHSRRPERPAPHGLRFLQTVELRYTYGLRVCLSILIVGGVVVLTGPDASIENLAGLLTRHRITRLATTPFHALGLAKWFAAQDFQPAHLDQVSTSGSIATRFIQEEVRRYLCSNFVIHYGANEVGGMTVAEPPLLAGHPDSIGFPVLGVEINIVRTDGTLASPGEMGLLRARGRDFPTQYINNPEASAKAFRHGWFYPGDLASRGRDGEIYYHGRADDLMNFNGIKIAPIDIEMALQSHPDVRQAISFMIDHPVHQDYPCVAVTVANAVSEEELLRHAQAKLGRRAPKLVMVLSEMPTVGVGKPDRKAVRQIALNFLQQQGT